MPIRAMTPDFIRPHYDQGLWRPQLLFQLLDEHASRTPDALAVADSRERLTYRQLAERSTALAGWLTEQDNPPGSVVAIQTGNRAALAIGHFACSRADLTFVPLSTQWRRTEMESLLRRSRVSVLVLPPPRKDADFLATVNAMRDDLPELRLVGGMDGLLADFDFDAVLKSGADAKPRQRTPDEPRFITVTSGTTDIPRMSQWTDNNLSFLLRDYAEAVEMAAGDVAVAIAPANTGATGYLFPVLAPLLCGAASVLLENWTPAGALDLLEGEHATHAAAIPTQLVKMLQEEGTAACSPTGPASPLMSSSNTCGRRTSHRLSCRSDSRCSTSCPRPPAASSRKSPYAPPSPSARPPGSGTRQVNRCMEL